MFPFVGPYTPYFGFDYGGIRNVSTMWPQMYVPFTNIRVGSKQVSRVAQFGVVIGHREPSDDGDNFSKRMHNPRMPQILPIGKSYNVKKGRSSSIGDRGGLLASGSNLPTPVAMVADLLVLVIMVF